ncbi:hypothetical protein B9Z65_241 [Elsinoe australis]|uniref:Uncharacterized protein n=1 Tax=Elsinoe australis TaxID=40998 RepID=A0A2P7Z7R4_9PEZI|nr:hypothetical protein B9Z65_241 [Elsinoe australis]
MKSSSVRAFSQFANKIHPQVALTRNESKRLLDSLKTSFRQHLDGEHSSERQNKSEQESYTSLSHTERHVASVLTNPLLATPLLPRNASLSPDTRHPIEIFNECVSNGTATFTIANQCLSAFHRSLGALTPDSRRKHILKYQPGTKVLQWLWANDLARYEVFTSGHRLSSSVVALLLREGREEAVWNWLETADQHFPAKTEQSNPKAILLRHLVYWKSKIRSGNLGSAYEAFLRAVGQSSTDTAGLEVLRPSGIYLLGESLRQKGAATAGTSLGSAVRFLETFPMWKQSDVEPPAVDAARLKLQCLGPKFLDGALDVAARLDIEAAKSTNGHYGTRVVKFLMALADTLQEHGTRQQARRLVMLLEGIQSEQQNKKATILSSEVRSLPGLLLQDIETWSQLTNPHAEPQPG